MPVLGELRLGLEIGYKDESHRFRWLACPDCGKERWILLKNGEPQRLLCKVCSHKRERCYLWAGGRSTTREGYIRVTLGPGDPFYPMGEQCKGRVMEHRLVMAQHLGRCLAPEELVHHLNGITSDNRIENLVLTTNSEHVSGHRREEVAAGIDPFHGKGYRRSE